MIFVWGLAGKHKHSYGWDMWYLYMHSVYLSAFVLYTRLQHVEREPTDLASILSMCFKKS